MNVQPQWGVSTEQATDTLKGIKGELGWGWGYGGGGGKSGREKSNQEAKCQHCWITTGTHGSQAQQCVPAILGDGHRVCGRDRCILGASWPIGVVQMMTPDSVRDPVSKNNVKSNRGRHVTAASGFRMRTLVQVGTPVFARVHTHRKKV